MICAEFGHSPTCLHRVAAAVVRDFASDRTLRGRDARSDDGFSQQRTGHSAVILMIEIGNRILQSRYANVGFSSTSLAWNGHYRTAMTCPARSRKRYRA